MSLTKFQKEALKNYRRFHVHGAPTPAGLMVKAWKNYVLMAIILAIAPTVPALLGTVFDAIIVGLFVFGIFLGAVLRDLGIFVRFVRLWPALSRIIDWNRR